MYFPNILPKDVIKHISLWKLCQQALEKTVLWWQSLHPALGVKKKWLNLLRIRQGNQIFYQSSLPMILSDDQALSPRLVAQELMTIFPQEKFLFNVQITAQDQLNFYPQDLLVGTYLQNLTAHHYFQFKSPNLSREQSELMVPLRYLYERCSQLLNLGQETKIIQLRANDRPATFYQWQEPLEYPFLRGNQLIVKELAEIELIEKLIMIIDLFDQVGNFNQQKMAKRLGEALLKFHQKCQIWGETLRNDVRLSQGRLGLIALTQFVLQWFLR